MEAFVPVDPHEEPWVSAQGAVTATDQVGEAVADMAFVLAFVGQDR